MKRWPNTAHWQRTVSALRAIRKSQRSWSRLGENILGLDRGGLRDHIDREDIDDKLLVVIEDVIAAKLRDHVANKVEELRSAENAAAEFALAVEIRRFDVEQAKKRANNDEVDALLHDMVDWMRRDLIQEAA